MGETLVALFFGNAQILEDWKKPRRAECIACRDLVGNGFAAQALKSIGRSANETPSSIERNIELQVPCKLDLVPLMSDSSCPA